MEVIDYQSPDREAIHRRRVVLLGVGLIVGVCHFLFFVFAVIGIVMTAGVDRPPWQEFEFVANVGSFPLITYFHQQRSGEIVRLVMLAAGNAVVWGLGAAAICLLGMKVRGWVRRGA